MAQWGRFGLFVTEILQFPLENHFLIFVFFCESEVLLNSKSEQTVQRFSFMKKSTAEKWISKGNWRISVTNSPNQPPLCHFVAQLDVFRLVGCFFRLACVKERVSKNKCWCYNFKIQIILFAIQFPAQMSPYP